MFRYTPFLVGAVLWAFALTTPAATKLIFEDDFQTGTLPTQPTPWDFTGLHYGAQAILTPSSGNPFLGEFGGGQTEQGAPLQGDVVKLNSNLPKDTVSVVLDFDVYLLRTWDGQDVPFGGPDTFGYGYNNTTLMSKTFSNGEGDQSYCRGTTLASW